MKKNPPRKSNGRRTQTKQTTNALDTDGRTDTKNNNNDTSTQPDSVRWRDSNRNSWWTGVAVVLVVVVVAATTDVSPVAAWPVLSHPAFASPPGVGARDIIRGYQTTDRRTRAHSAGRDRPPARHPTDHTGYVFYLRVANFLSVDRSHLRTTLK